MAKGHSVLGRQKSIPNTLRSLSERKAKEEAQHVEEWEKVARDEAQRARDESEQSKGLLEVEREADKERSLSEVQIKELEINSWAKIG